MFDHDHGFEIMWGPCPKCGIDWRETDADHPEAANPLPIIDYPPPTTSTNPEPKPMTPDPVEALAELADIVYERWWDALRWLRCHVLRRHYPQSAYESKPWEPLFDRRNGYYWRKTGRLECAVCHRDLGPNPQTDGAPGAWA